VIRTAKVLFCDNEHGFGGEVTIPEMSRIDDQTFIAPVTIAQLRKRAKAEGWGRVNGGDYCPGCMESM
jgi:hypothetical protein